MVAPEGFEPPTHSLGLTFTRFKEAKRSSAVEPR